jgi:LysM repeat protein
MERRRNHSAIPPDVREREREQAIAWAAWLDQFMDAPLGTSGEHPLGAFQRAPTPPAVEFGLHAPERPDWLDFSSYFEAVPRPARPEYEQGPGEGFYGEQPSEERANSGLRDDQTAQFARIAQEIRASWQDEVPADVSGYHATAAPQRPRPTPPPVYPAAPATPAATARIPVVAVAPTVAPRGARTPSLRLRVAQVSRRLADLATARSVVRIPGRAPRRTKGAAGIGTDVGNKMRVVKLPPVWLLANLLILLAAGWAIVPRLAIVTSQSACEWHVVVPGDTLGKLGTAHHTSALAIAHANGLPDPNQVYVGERLCIPLTFFASAGAAAIIPAPPQPPHYGPVSGVHNFITFALPYARRAHDATGWPTSMILAQWGLEHAWHLPSYTGYNFGNCGAVPGEPSISGINVPGSPAAFTYSKTPEDGLRVYIHVAHLSFYSGVAWAAQHGGVDAAARALGRSPWDAGHYTDHNDPGSSLVAILHAYNLYQYDAS